MIHHLFQGMTLTVRVKKVTNQLKRVKNLNKAQFLEIKLIRFK
jgi:hypothetical protein